MLGQRPPGGRCWGAWSGSVISEGVCRAENKAGRGSKVDLGEPDLGPKSGTVTKEKQHLQKNMAMAVCRADGGAETTGTRWSDKGAVPAEQTHGGAL